MKSIKFLFFFLSLTFVFTSCTSRLVDFTVISSKNTGMRADGKATEGKDMGFFGIGTHVKDAMDDALKNAGKGYDMLIDGVVRSKVYPFWGGYTVEGKAVKSEEIKLTMTEAEFEIWVENANIFDPENPGKIEVITETEFADVAVVK